MDLRAYKIYKKKKKEDKNRVGRCWMEFIIDQTFRLTFSGSSNQIFILDPFAFTVSSNIWFLIIALSAKHMRMCFERFYCHSNANNLWRATKNQKKTRSQTRQERKSKNGE